MGGGIGQNCADDKVVCPGTGPTCAAPHSGSGPMDRVSCLPGREVPGRALSNGVPAQHHLVRPGPNKDKSKINPSLFWCHF